MIIQYRYNIRYIKNNEVIYKTIKSKIEKNVIRSLNFYKNKKGFSINSSEVWHDKEDWWI